MKHTGWIVLTAVLVAAFALAVWTDAASEDANPAKHARVVAVDGGGNTITTGLPVYGLGATGADGYAKILDAPARVCHYVHVSVADNGAVVSFDGGSTDHVALPPNTSFLFEGLAMTASVEVHGKNLSAGNNYTNLRVSVW